MGIMLMAGPFVPPALSTFDDLGLPKFAVVALGAVLVGTAIFRFCPAYRLLGIRTCGHGETGLVRH